MAWSITKADLNNAVKALADTQPVHKRPHFATYANAWYVVSAARGTEHADQLITPEITIETSGAIGFAWKTKHRNVDIFVHPRHVIGYARADGKVVTHQEYCHTLYDVRRFMAAFGKHLPTAPN